MFGCALEIKADEPERAEEHAQQKPRFFVVVLGGDGDGESSRDGKRPLGGVKTLVQRRHLLELFETAPNLVSDASGDRELLPVVHQRLHGRLHAATNPASSKGLAAATACHARVSRILERHVTVVLRLREGAHHRGRGRRVPGLAHVQRGVVLVVGVHDEITRAVAPNARDAPAQPPCRPRVRPRYRRRRAARRTDAPVPVPAPAPRARDRGQTRGEACGRVARRDAPHLLLELVLVALVGRVLPVAQRDRAVAVVFKGGLQGLHGAQHAGHVLHLDPRRPLPAPAAKLPLHPVARGRARGLGTLRGRPNPSLARLLPRHHNRPVVDVGY
mmetsp:Transcript_10626/g.24740  ORF Transcript_10626/g.24740 Transcript_10626/m.24740 type:complete len:330 (-) Transcript_10626:889-1878(-)